MTLKNVEEAVKMPEEFPKGRVIKVKIIKHRSSMEKRQCVLRRKYSSRQWYTEII